MYRHIILFKTNQPNKVKEISQRVDELTEEIKGLISASIARA